MKRSLITLTCLCAFLTFSFAQKITEGSLKPLVDYGKAKVVLNFNDALIHGMTVNDFADYEKDWYVDQPIIWRKFISGMIKKCNSIRLGNEIDAEIYITVNVLSVSTKGDYKCEVFITNSQGDKIACISGLNARGGTFGSKLNLIKDGAEHTGVLLGKFLERSIKKYK